jgi:hypothetical protein
VTIRVTAALLVAAAAALHLGYTLPAREQIARTADDFKRLRDERREVVAAVAASQRRQAALMAALHAASASASTPDTAVADARRTVVAALADTPLRNVRLSVRPGVAPSAALVQVQGVGSYPDAMAFSTRLLEPGSGLALSEARFNPSAAGVAFELALVRVVVTP